MRGLIFVVSISLSLAFSQVLHAELVKSRIQIVSQRAGTVQVEAKHKKVVMRTDENTKFDGFASLKELSPPELIEVEREPGQAAARI
jgi:hypothetical protein